MDNHLAVDNLIRDAVVDNRVRPSILLPAVNVLSSLVAVTVSALDPASSAAIQRYHHYITPFVLYRGTDT